VLAESKFPLWYPYYINWATAILLEITLLVVSIITPKLPDAFDLSLKEQEEYTFTIDLDGDIAIL